MGRVRLAALGAALAAALALGGAAPASHRPPLELHVFPERTTLGRPAQHGLEVRIASEARATASLTLYAPPGYGIDLGIPAGVRLGTARLALVGKEPGVDVITPLEATVTVADPARYAADPGAQACASGHAAVWELTALGQAFPFFVDRTSGTEAELGAYRLRTCFGSSVAVTEIDIELEGGLTNPSDRGTYTWRAFVTPYAPAGTPDAAGTIEARALVPFPQTLTVNRSYRPGTRTLVVSGRVTAAGEPRDGVTVRLQAGPGPDPESLEGLAVLTTDDAGGYVYRRRIPRKRTDQVLFILAYVNPYAGECSGPSPAPGGCVDETLSPPPPRFVRVVIPKLPATR